MLFVVGRLQERSDQTCNNELQSEDLHSLQGEECTASGQQRPHRILWHWRVHVVHRTHWWKAAGMYVTKSFDFSDTKACN